MPATSPEVRPHLGPVSIDGALGVRQQSPSDIGLGNRTCFYCFSLKYLQCGSGGLKHY